MNYCEYRKAKKKFKAINDKYNGIPERCEKDENGKIIRNENGLPDTSVFDEFEKEIQDLRKQMRLSFHKASGKGAADVYDIYEKIETALQRYKTLLASKCAAMAAFGALICAIFSAVVTFYHFTIMLKST